MLEDHAWRVRPDKPGRQLDETMLQSRQGFQVLILPSLTVRQGKSALALLKLTIWPELPIHQAASDSIRVTVLTPIPNCFAILRLPVPSALALRTALSTFPVTLGRPNFLP